MVYRYYWEDLVVGETVSIGEYTFTESAIVSFASQFDPQPFHIDPVSARDSIYGGMIASGWHTCSIMGSPGLEEIRWLKPVRPGDTVNATRTIEESRPTSKPDRGIVLTRWDAYNQYGDQVLLMRGYGLFGRRVPANPEDKR